MSQLYTAQVPQMSTAQKIITGVIVIGVLAAIIWGLSNMKSKKSNSRTVLPAPRISPQLPDDQVTIAEDIKEVFKDITGTNGDGPIVEQPSYNPTDPMAWIRGNKTQVPETLPVETVVSPPAQTPSKTPAKPNSNISLDDLYEEVISSPDGIPLLPA